MGGLGREVTTQSYGAESGLEPGWPDARGSLVHTCAASKGARKAGGWRLEEGPGQLSGRGSCRGQSCANCEVLCKPGRHACSQRGWAWTAPERWCREQGWSRGPGIAFSGPGEPAGCWCLTSAKQGLGNSSPCGLVTVWPCHASGESRGAREEHKASCEPRLALRGAPAQ